MIAPLLKIVLVTISYLFLLIYIFLLPVLAANPKEEYVRFLTLADIHFDPFIACYGDSLKPCPLIQSLNKAPVEEWESVFAAYDKIPATYRQDTNFPLLISMLSKANMVADAQRVEFVLVLGDLLGHDFRKYYRQYTKDNSILGYRAFVNKTLVFLNRELAKTFPLLDVYQLVGNNDTYQYDYFSEPHGIFFKEIAGLWPRLIKSQHNRLLIQQQLRDSGYYAFDLPGQPEIRFIMLNSVLFSNKAKGRDIDLAAKQELNWLHTELAAVSLKHQKAFIAMHIPPTIDINLGARIHLFTFMELWQPTYKQLFQQTVQDYSSVILAIFAGHLHSDWLSIWTVGKDEIPIVGTPSISPIFGNSPGFKVYRYVKKPVQLIDYSTYYSPTARGTLSEEQGAIP